MEKLGMPNSFIHMINLLFQYAAIFVNINNQDTKPLKLYRGVRQGCPLPP